MPLCSHVFSTDANHLAIFSYFVGLANIASIFSILTIDFKRSLKFLIDVYKGFDC